MKILVAHNFYQRPGGEDAVFRAETALLRQHGHDVIEYVEHNDRVDQMGAVQTALALIWSTDSQARLQAIIADQKPDIAHFHNTFPLISPAAYYVCRKAGVPVVQTLHNYRLFCPTATFFRAGRICEDCLGKTPPWPAIKHRCYRGSRIQSAGVAAMLTVHRLLRTWHEQVDCFIALTEFARRKFVEGGLPARKIVVKPNFVYPNPESEQAVRSDFTLFVGRLSPEKGIMPLLNVWRKLPDIPLKILGEGPLQPEIEKFIEANQLNSISLLGFRSSSEVLTLMRAARFLVFPSVWYEGFPVTIAEAFACGTPIVASNIGAIAEMIVDQKTGLLFEAGDERDMIRKIAWAYQHPLEMNQMGVNGQGEFMGHYSAEQNYEMLMAIYHQVGSG